MPFVILEMDVFVHVNDLPTFHHLFVTLLLFLLSGDAEADTIT